jgi:signal transduction histidine kinase
VIFFNRQYAALINVGAEQVQGVDPETYYADRQEYNDILQRLQNGEQIFERLIELNIPGAGTKWALATYLQIYYQGGSAVLGWFHDITETIQVERLKTEFVSTVSHELRTPLTAISGALGLIAGGVLGAMPAQA